MKKRWKRTAAVILALSMLAAPPGIPAGALAESRESIDGIRGYIEESAKEGHAFAESPTEFSAEPSLEETGTADSQNLAEMELQADGISMQMETVEVNYQKADWNGSTVIYSGKTAADCIRVESSTEAVTWDAGWYVVSGSVTISEPITVSGDVNLILTDRCVLIAEKGIVVTINNSLTIYAQAESTGTLTATGVVSGQDSSAGIGGSTSVVDSGQITIHGGVIDAASGAGYYAGAGIGGGSNTNGNGGTGNNITIYGGNVTAKSRSPEVSGAGIGGGAGGKDGGSGNNITIYGGIVHATGSHYGGAGIGGGAGSNACKSGNGTDIYIKGGAVTAVGGDYGAGIGGGGGYIFSIMGNVTTIQGGIGSVAISGGIVDAKGGAGDPSGSYAGAPIGNGGNASGTVSVSKDNAIVFENGVGTVCGSVNFDGSYNIPADYSLNIPAVASLSGNGTLTGGGTFTAELSENIISVPTDIYYNGTDRAAELQSGLSARLDKGITLCGKTFMVSGWTVAVTQTDDLTYTATYTNENDSTITKTITLLQSGTALDGAVQTYNGGTQTAQFTASDTITVKAMPAATGKASARSAVYTAGFAAPDAGKMAVFVNGMQVSAPAGADADGSYTMTVSAADVLMQGQAGQDGQHTLIVKFVGNASMANAEAPVKVTVTPNLLTADMVTLSAESAVYSGVEQKPAVTVSGLAEGTDYKVAFQDGFKNAGTYTVTISGKGIYAGTVEKNFTIGKATPEITWESGSVTLTYTGQPAAVEPVVKLVNSESYEGPVYYTWYGVTSSLVLPTDAGTYSGITANVPEQGNYAAAESGRMALFIKEADQSAPDAPFAADDNIKDTSITLTAVENAEYSRDGTNWQDSPVFTGLEANTAYTFYVRLKADGNHNASPSSAAASITTRKTALDGASVTVSGSYTYNGTAIVPAPANVVVMLNGKTIDSSQYTISAASNIHAGTAAVTVTAAADGDYSGSASAAFTIGKAALTVRAGGQTITYGEGIVQGTGQVTADGLCGSDSLDSITLTASSGQVAAENKTIMPYSARIQNADGEDVTASYDITYETGTLTINRAQGLLTVPETSFNKKFGDAAFSLNCSTNGDGTISYASSDEGVVSVSADGTARITGAGKATVTVSLTEGANYTGDAEGKEVTVTVDKAAAPDTGQETRNYTYASGSKGAVTIDVAGKLPADRGKTDYTVTKADEKGILSGDVSVDVNGKLTFTVLGGQSEGDTASIRVTAVMANYGDAEYTVEIKLVEKIAVNFTLTEQPQDGIYDGKPHNGYAGLAAQTVNGSYTGAVRFWYAGTGETSYDSAIPPVRAGSYTVTASVPEDNAEYAGSSEAVPFTIRRAAITIKAENRTAQAGSPLPELTYTVSGLAENEQLAAAPQLSCSADMNEAGVYPITAGGAKAPDADNYEEEITYEDGTLTVLDSAVHVTGISLDKTTLSLSAGSTGRLTAALSPENATDKGVSWTSSSPAVAAVDSSGNITAVSAGTAVITVTAADGGYTASCTVTVRSGTGSSSGSSGSTGSSGSGGSSGSSSGGSGSTGSGTGQAAKQPFLKDSSGREGWDVIRAEAETAAAAPAGGIVAVDMNGAVSVPGSVFAAVRGKDVTLRFDMGGGITWSVNGRDVASETADGTDFSVRTEAGAIPKDLIEKTSGGLAHMELSLAHDGAFGFTATLTLRIVSSGNGITAGSSGTAAEYTGMYANLFYYNQNLRSLEFICAGQIGEDGTADLPFAHASDYTVILSTAPMGGTGTPGSTQEPGEAEKPQEPARQAVKSVKLSKTRYTYNGKPKKPSVTVVDTAGRKIPVSCYTVSYQNNKKAGKATATVIFKGGYSGTVKKTFTIRPAGTSIQKLTAVSSGFAVKWKKKTAQTSGYQIQYSADAGFQGSSTRGIFVKNNSRVQKTVKKLKGGKNYYVRIRTYKIVKADGKNARVSSAWSKTRKVKTLPAASEKEASFAGSAAAFLIPEKEDGKKRAA